MTRRLIMTSTLLASMAMAQSAVADEIGETADWVATFAASVQRCWLPPENAALVIVAFDMNRDGSVIEDSVRSIPRDLESTDAFMAAKRAILRCGRQGYDLPADQFELWKEIELTFDPERQTGAV